MTIALCKAKKVYQIKVVYNDVFSPEKEETAFSTEDIQTANAVFKTLDKISNKTRVDGKPLFQSIRLHRKLIPTDIIKDAISKAQLRKVSKALNKAQSKKDHPQTNSQPPALLPPANSSPAPLPSPDTTHSTSTKSLAPHSQSSPHKPIQPTTYSSQLFPYSYQ